jgi:hypothetical protein
LGVAEGYMCNGTATHEIILEANGKDFKKANMTCEGEALYAKSEGFTGWAAIDAAISGFIAWVTFGAVAP